MVKKLIASTRGRGKIRARPRFCKAFRAQAASSFDRTQSATVSRRFGEKKEKKEEENKNDLWFPFTLNIMGYLAPIQPIHILLRSACSLLATSRRSAVGRFSAADGAGVAGESATEPGCSCLPGSGASDSQLPSWWFGAGWAGAHLP